MNVKEITEEEIYNLLSENDERAKDLIFNKYNYIIGLLLKKYNPIIKKLQIDHKEIYSEALYGFSDAINSFNPTKDASLATFITICVERRVKKFLRYNNTEKNKTMNNAYSLDYKYNDSDLTLSEVLSDNNVNDPLNKLTTFETYNELNNKIEKELSSFEYQVFLYMSIDLNYLDIASILNKDPKQIDNTMQRIKNKIKIILNT